MGGGGEVKGGGGESVSKCEWGKTGERRRRRGEGRVGKGRSNIVTTH